MPDLLLELFSEEIPARMQARAAEDLKRLVTGHLVEGGLTYAHATAFATPRRLALSLSALPDRTPDMREERKGPRTDAPEKAIEGFLRSTGLTRDTLEVRDDKKGQVYFAVIEKPGRAAADVVAEAVEATVRGFPWPKSMRWGEGSLRWVRPLSRILCVLADDAGAHIVPLEIDGLRASDETEGHRFMARGPFRAAGLEDYEAKLRAHKVLLDPAERAEKIWHDATQLAFAQGMELVEDRGLLAEVAGLVEWPVVLMGEIGAEFLHLPPEVLQTSMKEHQKFFSVKNPATGRIERFVTVANIEAPDGGAAILDGNRRVLAARLADAAFFWENDLRKVKDRGLAGMEEMAAPLANVVFHEKLGTQAERIARIAALAREIAPAVGADPDMAEEAARVAKADLASEMVYEFPELQGVMGGHYARAAGLSEEVAAAAEAHYRPLGPSDDVPSEPVAVAVALADKIDMLTGFWAIDEKPTGSKDPFALRRAAIGINRLLMRNLIRLDLGTLVAGALDTERLPTPLPGKPGEPGFEIWKTAIVTSVWSFLEDRLQVVLRDEGVGHGAIRACFALQEQVADQQLDLVLLVARVKALQTFLGTPDGENLLAAYRRASNIVAAEEKKDGVEYSGAPDVKFAETEEERALFAALDALEPRVAKALAAEDFAAAMDAMAELRAPVDAFFDAVLVNAENQVVRRNRLCLLTRIRALMQQVAVWDAIEG